MYEAPPPTQYGEFQSLASAHIKGSGENYKGILLAQISRLAFLITMGTAKYNGQAQMFSEEALAKASYRGIQFLQTLMTPLLDLKYAEDIKPTMATAKMGLKNLKEREIEFYNSINEWLEKLMPYLSKMNLIPEEEIELEVD